MSTPRSVALASVALVLTGWPSPSMMGGGGTQRTDPPGSPITASVEASRTSGVAPLYVFFDATVSAHTDSDVDPFRDLECHWDFGETTGQTWAVSGDTKDADRGCISAHVFESGGGAAKTITLTVSDEAGNVDTDTVDVTVTDPDTVFAASTYCIATDATPTGGADGCPTGSTGLQTSDYETAMTTCGAAGASGAARCLFRRGQTWTKDGSTLTLLTGPIRVGAYGATGGHPIVDGSSAGAIAFHDIGGSGAASDDVAFSEIDFIGNDSTAATLLLFRANSTHADGISNFLALDMLVDKIAMILLSNRSGNLKVPDLFAFVDVTVTDAGRRSFGLLDHTRSAWMGVTCDALAGVPVSGCIRWNYGSKIILSHSESVGDFGNDVWRQAGGRPNPYAAGSHVEDPDYQPFWLIRRNTMGGGAGDDTLGGFGPGSAQTIITDMVVEDNFVPLVGTTAFQLCADRARVSGNIIARTAGALSGAMISFNEDVNCDPTDPDPTLLAASGDGVRAFNNTIYSSLNPAGTGISHSGPGEDVRFRSNAMYSPADSTLSDLIGSLGSGSDVAQSNNIQVDANPFTTGTFTDPDSDFIPALAGALDGTGFDFLSATEDGEADLCDYSGNVVGTDAGARERVASACAP